MRPDRARRPDPGRRHGAVPGPAGVRGDRTHARRGPARGGACQGLPGHRAAAGGADGARGACGTVLCGAPDAPDAGIGARRLPARHHHRTAPAAGQLRAGRAGTVLSGRPDQLRRAAGRRWHARALLDATPQRDAAGGVACAGRCGACGAGGMPAHGRRLRRQGIAVRAVRLHRRGGGAAAEPAGEAAPRPRRRLHDHRPAPRLRVRLRHRLRRQRPHPRRRGDDDLQRRLQRRPEPAGDDARDLPLRQRLLAARSRHPRLLREDEHAEQHRLPRLRRAAGRADRRADPGAHRAPAGARCAGGAARQLLRQDRQQRHALPPDGHRQRHPRTGRRAGGQLRLRGAAPCRRAPSTPAARCSSAGWR